MIRHLLLIKFKESATQAELEHVKSMFALIPERITGIDSVEWGLNNSPENLNRGYTHAVLMTFADEAARERYLPHPEHEALKEFFVPLLEDIVVFDYSTPP